jgi:ribokinase
MTDSASILVVGSINTDLVILGDRLPSAGETVVGGEFYRCAGGKGANQAVAAARVSTRGVAFIAAVGDDPFGVEALNGLRQEALNCNHVRVFPGQASGVALILVDAQGQNMISVAPGANSRLSEEFIDHLPDSLFKGARILLASLEVPFAAVCAALKRARQHGLTTILNPAPVDSALLDPAVFSLVDVLTPNETEAAALTPGLPCDGLNQLDCAAHRAQAIRRRGCGAVVVTLGSEGACVVDRAVRHIPGHRVDAVDATAAGDALNGALAAALAEGASLFDAARFANAAAAQSVTRRGAQPSLPSRVQIEQLLHLSERQGP